MEPDIKPKTSAKDFFLNLGAFVALYTSVVYVLNLLFTVIDHAYPPIMGDYYTSGSISWPVAVLIIFFPVFILLQWILAKESTVDPEKRVVGIRKWLTYITLFFSGLTLAIDLVTVLYTFLDGQNLTTGFLLKILAVFIVALAVFVYYISDARGKLTPQSRMIWRVIAAVIVVGSIVWAFAVLGSPRTQQLLRYDEQRVSDLQTINEDVTSYFQDKASLPSTLSDISNYDNYLPKDPQTNQPYEYVLVGQSAKTYQLCATFNLASSQQSGSATRPYYLGQQDNIGDHPAGHYCYNKTIPASMNPYPPVPSTTPGKLPM